MEDCDYYEYHAKEPITIQVYQGVFIGSKIDRYNIGRKDADGILRFNMMYVNPNQTHFIPNGNHDIMIIHETTFYLTNDAVTIDLEIRETPELHLNSLNSLTLMHLTKKLHIGLWLKIT